MKKLLLSCISAMVFFAASAQEDPETSAPVTDPIYNRPFISLGKTSTAVGGYLEGNTNYFAEDGITEGFSMELRRFNVFLFSRISDRIRFLSELEFEHGTEEIALETAVIDFRVNPSLIFRAGILLPPLGYFNLNHDSPKWEIVERPLVSTQIIPSTFSEVGFGFNGKFYPQNVVITYDIYITQGLGDGVISNSEGRTFIPAGKHEGMFAEDNNGSPAVTGKLGFIKRNFLELGFSYYGGIYNSFRSDGEIIASKRWLHISAVDWSFPIKKLSVVGEAAYASVSVPSSLSPVLGSKQWGVFTDFVYPVIKKPILKWEDAVINSAVRLEKVDFNSGSFGEGGRIYDEITAVAAGLSFRPAPTTVIRANYRYEWHRDLPGNPAVRRAGIQVGVASYF